MYKIYCLALIFAFILLYNGNTYSQSNTTIQDILETVSDKVVSLEDDSHKEIVNVTIDLLVNQGKKTVWRNLDPSFSYDVMVIGDRRISKLKLTVYKQNKDTWDYVNEISGSTPKLKITPLDFEQYEFTVTVDEFKTGKNTGHFALILYHENPEKK
jgi:hypothetical protein